MYIEQLKYIVEVANTGSLSTAAQNLHVTLSALSQAITKLEEELQVKIFKRSRIGTLPTNEGLKLIEKAKETLFHFNEVIQIAEEFSNNTVEQFTVFTIPGQMDLILEVIDSFCEEHPNAMIMAEEKGAHDIFEDIKNAKATIGLTYFQNELKDFEEDLEFYELVDVNIKLCVNKKNPLSLKTRLRSEDLINYPFALYDDSNVSLFFKSFFMNHNDLNVKFTTKNIETIKRALISDSIISFCIDITAKKDPLYLNGEVAIIDIEGHNIPALSLGWIRPKEYNLSPTMKKFMEHVELKLNAKS